MTTDTDATNVDEAYVDANNVEDTDLPEDLEVEGADGIEMDTQEINM